MLKISNTKSAKPKKGGVEVGGGSRAGRDRSEIDDRKKIDGDEVDSGEVKDDEIEKKVQKVQKMSKSKNLSKSKKTVGSSDFLIPGVKLVFTKLRQAFLKAPIFYHFDPKHHIWIGTDASGYAIGRVFSQLTSDNSGQ